MFDAGGVEWYEVALWVYPSFVLMLGLAFWLKAKLEKHRGGE